MIFLFLINSQKYCHSSSSQVYKPVLGSNNDPLFQSFREGIDTYRIDVPDGDYEVELGLTDFTNTLSDERVIDIFINEKAV